MLLERFAQRHMEPARLKSPARRTAEAA